MPWFRILSVFLVILAANLIVPWMTWNSNLMGSDPAMWFYGGVLLTEVSLLGGIFVWRCGVPEWRFLLGVFASLAIVIVGITAMAMCESFSRRDALAYLYLVMPILIGMATCDLLLLGWINQGLFGPIRTAGDQIALEQSKRSFQFSTMFLFGLTVLAGLFLGVVNILLKFEGTTTRPFLNYAAHPLWFLLLLFVLFWMIHASILGASLGYSLGAWGILSVVIAMGGTELVRRIQSFKDSVQLDYLNWEFPMIVSGFFVAHWVLGLMLRWMGWSLKTC